VGKVKVTGALGAKPKIAITPINATPPAKLKIKDLAKGHGKAAKAGETVTVQYDGVLYENGTEFDASWNRHQPFSFPLGAGRVIPGWDKGVVGMKVGGRRVLTIPPELGYGPQGSGPIPPNSTLVFVVDMLKIQK
jgi:peptidylprolyl isomerase